MTSTAGWPALPHHRCRPLQVAPLGDVVSTADIFVTCTGNRGVIGVPDMAAMKNGAVLANMGHFEGEIDVEGLAAVPGVRRATIKHQAR